MQFKRNALKIYLTLAVSIILCVGVLGCAKPNYKTDTNDSSTPSTQQQDADKTNQKRELPANRKCFHENLCANFDWISTPNEDEYGEAKISFTFADGAPTKLNENQSISTLFWMPSMQHGTSPKPILIKRNDGTISVTRVFLVMHGKWQFHISLSDSSTDRSNSNEVIFDYSY